MTITRKELFRLGIAGLATAAATGGSVAASPAKPAEAKKTHNPQPSRSTLIRNADILAMDTKLGELTGMDVLIKDGKIAAIAKGMKVDDAEVIDATEKI